MRLTCPNCGAQYEVPDEVIPETGRDVQCSNCGDTWYQYHPDHPPRAQDDPAAAVDWDSPAPEAEAEAKPEPEPDPETGHRRRQELDPDIANVLREEAARERQARERESGGLETQGELGIAEPADQAEKRRRQSQDRMRRLRGAHEEAGQAAVTGAEAAGSEPAGAAAASEPDPGARRNLLPDIDEINSSLGAGSKRDSTAMTRAREDAAAPLPPEKSGFRRGFLLMMLIAVIALLLYVYAPQIGETVPGVKPYLASYVETANGWRLWLDGAVADALQWLDGMSIGAGG